MKKAIALLLAVTLLLSACSGKESSYTVEPAESVAPTEQTKPTEALEEIGCAGTDTMPWDNAQITDFGLGLLKGSVEAEKNALISPISVLATLAMTANGAEGETLAQMETVLGRSKDALNQWYEDDIIKAHSEYLHLANAIYLRDDGALTVKEAFLQTLEKWYDTGIYMTSFNESTLREINQFVEDNTGGMVKNILDKIPEEAVMYLVNALAFEARWAMPYNEYAVSEQVFTTEDGREQPVELMYAEEYDAYLKGENFTGFFRNYEGGRYAFVALLPNGGVSVEELADSLSGDTLARLWNAPQEGKVLTAIPKFQTEFSVEMDEVLKTMGIRDAFDVELADFSHMATHTSGNIYISRVLHKTFISVAEQGTKAGAATVVEMAAGAAMEPEETKEVILNRPFLYMILDTKTNTPIFMGALMNMGEEDFLYVEPNENEHVHLPAQEPGLCAYPKVGYCGNTVTTVKHQGREYSFMYEASLALTDILTNQLTYDPDQICRCIAPITVETEFGGPYYVNLEESFARCDAGQASLTEAQLQTIRDIVDQF